MDGVDSSVYSVVDSQTNSGSQWNGFVHENKGNYCQLYEWRHVLEKVYGLKTYYLVIAHNTEWVGILPLALVPGLAGSTAVSVPYCNYGGSLVSKDIDPARVLNSALAFLWSRGIRRVEIRELGHTGDDPITNEVTLMLDLPDSLDLFWKTIGDKARSQVRKAKRAGLDVLWGREQASGLYEVYAENMGRLGTPVHAREFIDEILASFKDNADVLTVRLQGRVIAAMLVLKFGDTWIDPIASSLIEFRKLNPNMLLYWEALQQAMASGMRRFDFGRSRRDSGTYKFKRQWGAMEVPLNYYSFRNGVRVSSSSVDIYRGNKAAMVGKVWSILPRGVQRILGPKIRRYIP